MAAKKIKQPLFKKKDTYYHWDGEGQFGDYLKQLSLELEKGFGNRRLGFLGLGKKAKHRLKCERGRDENKFLKLSWQIDGIPFKEFEKRIYAYQRRTGSHPVLAFFQRCFTGIKRDQKLYYYCEARHALEYAFDRESPVTSKYSAYRELEVRVKGYDSNLSKRSKLRRLLTRFSEELWRHANAGVGFECKGERRAVSPEVEARLRAEAQARAEAEEAARARTRALKKEYPRIYGEFPNYFSDEVRECNALIPYRAPFISFPEGEKEPCAALSGFIQRGFSLIEEMARTFNNHSCTNYGYIYWRRPDREGERQVLRRDLLTANASRLREAAETMRRSLRGEAYQLSRRFHEDKQAGATELERETNAARMRQLNYIRETFEANISVFDELAKTKERLPKATYWKKKIRHWETYKHFLERRIQQVQTFDDDSLNRVEIDNALFEQDFALKLARLTAKGDAAHRETEERKLTIRKELLWQVRPLVAMMCDEENGEGLGGRNSGKENPYIRSERWGYRLERGGLPFEVTLLFDKEMVAGLEKAALKAEQEAKALEHTLAQAKATREKLPVKPTGKPEMPGYRGRNAGRFRVATPVTAPSIPMFLTPEQREAEARQLDTVVVCSPCERYYKGYTVPSHIRVEDPEEVGVQWPKDTPDTIIPLYVMPPTPVFRSKYDPETGYNEVESAIDFNEDTIELCQDIPLPYGGENRTFCY